MFIKLTSILGTFSILILVQILVKADPIHYKDCGSNPSVQINLFDISGCSTFPCNFNKNTNVTLKLNFTTTVEFKSVTNQLFGTLSGVKIPFPLPGNEKDACSNGISCPLTANTSFFETITIPILNEYPDVSVFVTVELVDQNSKAVICALFPAKIVG